MRTCRFMSILLLSFVMMAGCSGSNGLAETKNHGDQIISALQAFHAKNNRYPSDLKELVPTYLVDVPLPTWGLRTWKYYGDTTDFSLGVDESTSTGDGDSHWFRYMGPKHGWQLGD